MRESKVRETLKLSRKYYIHAYFFFILGTVNKEIEINIGMKHAFHFGMKIYDKDLVKKFFL